jgi:hypothetical protein
VVQPPKQDNEEEISSVDAVGLAHSALDGQGLDVLPVLLEQRNQEIDSDDDVLLNLIGALVDVTNSNGKAHDLLHLELDGGLSVNNLGSHVIIVGEQSRELSSLAQTRAQDTGQLLDQGVRGKESIVGLS